MPHTEIERMWWRLPRRDHELEQWWFDLLDLMHRESPISFAGLQFDCAMNNAAMQDELRRRRDRGTDQ